MSVLDLASDPEDATALESAETRHARLAGELAGRVKMLFTAVDRDPSERRADPRRARGLLRPLAAAARRRRGSRALPRRTPHALRHATVFGALDAVPAGTAMVLIAHHDPLPLLGQIEQRNPGVFSVGYLERGPEAWRLRLSHR